MSAPAAATERLELDVAAERETSLLRLAAGIVALPLGLFLLVGAHPWAVRALGLAAVVASAFWAFAYRKARKTMRNASAFYLELRPDEMVLSLGAEERRIAWAEVRDVEQDEESLSARIELEDGEVVSIPSCFRGVALHDLVTMIAERRDHASSADAG